MGSMEWNGYKSKNHREAFIEMISIVSWKFCSRNMNTSSCLALHPWSETLLQFPNSLIFVYDEGVSVVIKALQSYTASTEKLGFVSID